VKCEVKTPVTGGSALSCPELGRIRIGIGTVLCDGHYALWMEGKRMDITEGRRKTRQVGVHITDGRITVSAWANEFIRRYAKSRSIPVKRLISSILEGWAMRQMTGEDYSGESDPPAGASGSE